MNPRTRAEFPLRGVRALARAAQVVSETAMTGILAILIFVAVIIGLNIFEFGRPD